MSETNKRKTANNMPKYRIIYHFVNHLLFAIAVSISLLSFAACSGEVIAPTIG